MDQYTEVKRTSWFGRFIKAITSVIFAPLFLFAGFFLLRHGEINHARTTFGLKAVIHEVEKLEDAKYGDVIHVSDVIQSPEKWLLDEETGLDLKALKLYRKVYTWQWVEKKTKKKKNTNFGGEKEETTYTYTTKWVSEYNYKDRTSNKRDYEFDHRRFRYKEGHENIDFKPYQSRLFKHDNITFGNYSLDEILQKAVQNFKLLTLEANMFPLISIVQLDSISKAECPSRETFRKELKGTKSSLMGGGSGGLKTSSLFLGRGNPAEPVVGDTRLEYWYAPDEIYSIVAKKTGAHLEAVENDSLFIRLDLPCGGAAHIYNNSFALLFVGKQSLKEMFRVTHKENDIMHIVLFRFGGLLFMVGGFLILGAPVQLLFSWIPFIGILWEKAVFKLMQVIGTFVALSISVFYFLRYNSVSNLTIYDFYFGVGVLLFLVFCNRLRVSVSSGGEEIYGDEF